MSESQPSEMNIVELILARDLSMLFMDSISRLISELNIPCFSQITQYVKSKVHNISTLISS